MNTSYCYFLKNKLTLLALLFASTFLLTAQTRSPFNGVISIPGILESENFDNGGEGISYHDNEPENRSGTNYRTEGVDVGTIAAGGYCIGYTTANEWQLYSVDVESTGLYDVTIFYSAGRDGANMTMEIDDSVIVSTYDLYKTTGWEDYQPSVITSVSLKKGLQTIKVTMNSGGFNLDKISFQQNQSPYGDIPTLPGSIEAENYDQGGEGAAYHDTDTINSGKTYRTGGVDISGDATNGYVVDNTEDGEWMEYTVNITDGAFYDFSVIYSVLPNTNAEIKAEFKDENIKVFDSLVLSNKDNNTSRDTASVQKLYLYQGTHTLRMSILKGGCALDKFEVMLHDFKTDSLPVSRHPTIWVNKNDKPRILENISKYTWASSLFSQLKSNVDSKKNLHKSNPSTLLNTIPARGGSRSTHTDIITLGVEAGLLYYLTDNEDYAQLAADILSDYTLDMGTKKNGDICYTNDEFMDSRISWPRLALIYDFVHPFLIKPGTTVFDNGTKTRKAYNFEMARTTFIILANLVFDKGGLGSNHSVLEGNGALFPILCLEDEAERNAYKTKFWNGTSHQDAFTWSLGNFTKAEGMWPETVTYGKGPQELMLQMMEVVDRNWPEYNVFDNNMRILDGAFVYENFKYPNNISTMAYGDSRRQSLDTDELYRNVLATSTRKGFDDQVSKAYPIVKQFHTLAGGFKPKWEDQGLNYDMPLQLLWTVNIPDSVQAEKIVKNTTATVTHAGIIMQRNYNCTNDMQYGLMCYTGGAHYVHSHLSGLDMELYGSGFVMSGVGADMPNPNDRGLDINRHYYRIYAGHNTVIVNGKSQGRDAGSWKSDGMLWQNTTLLEAAEPKALTDPISENFSFSSQFLDDKVNNCNQQRIMSVVRTSPTTGYYLDLFRSKSLATNNFNDYVYHNIGDKIELFDAEGNPLPLTTQASRYPSFDVTDADKNVVKFPGWHYFANIKTSSPETGMVRAKISLVSKYKYMHALMPQGFEREYTTTTAPPILEAEGGYDKKDARVLTIRQTGEAWNRPFITVYEPSASSTPTITSVENIVDGNVVIGAIVISKIGETTITDYIIAQQNNKAVYENGMKDFRFEGRFAIVRKAENNGKTKLDLYIGDGKSLTFKDHEVTGNAANKAFASFDIDSIYSSTKKHSAEQLFQVSPNPSNGKLNISINKALDGTYSLYTMNGKLIMQGEISKQKNIQIHQKTPGIYLVKIETSKQSYVQKVRVK